MQSLKKGLVILTAATMLWGMVGCSGAEGSTNESSTTASTEDPAWQEASTTPFGKYPEEVKYTLGKTSVSYSALSGTEYEGDNDSNNAWTRYFKEKLNVQNENLFEANDGDDYNQKVSMAIVSGEIPDIMTVGDFDTLQQLYENDLIADLTEAYKNCASDKIKEIYDSYSGRCLETATFDGKLMALPTTEISHGPGILWLRKDWMDKLGLSEPKTLADMENIIKEFVEKDPGGNGAGKTVGLVVDTEIAGTSGAPYQLNNIFALYGAYPKQWLDNGSGGAVYGSVQPEMKPALEKLAQMYKDNLIDKQLAVRTSDDRKALLTGGQSGSFLDNWWGSWTVADSLTLNPEAEWVPYVCPQDENGTVSMFSGKPNSGYTVVRKGFEHPELLFKMASAQYDLYRYQETDAKELNDYQRLNVSGSPLAINIDYYDAFTRSSMRISDALDKSNRDGLNALDGNSYDSYKQYLDAVAAGGTVEAAAWAGYASNITCSKLVSSSSIKEINPVFFGTTAAMPLKWPTLQKMELEMYLKVITGEESIDAFDSYVESWKKTGGDEITAEVNEMIAQ